MSAVTLLPIADGRSTAGLAWRLLRRRRLALVGTAVAFVTAAAAGVVPPYAIGRLVDAVRAGEEAATIYAWSGLIAAAAVVGAVATAAAIALLSRAGAPALAEIREDVLDRALHLDAHRVEEAGAGDVLSRVGDDVRQVSDSFDEALPMLLTSAFAIVFTLAALTGLDWRLGLAGLGALPFYLLAIRWYLPRSAPVYRAERVAHGERAGALVSGLRGVATLRAFGREELAVGRVDQASRRAVGLTVEVFVLLTRFWGRFNRAELVGLVLVLSTGYWLVQAEAVTVGAATAAALYFHRLFNPIGALLMVLDAVQSAGASLTRLAGVVLLPAHGSAPLHPDSAPSLELHDVVHAYEADRPVVHGVSVHVPAGGRVALVGASGAGKTTLAAVAAGQLAPTAGQVLIGGEVVTAPQARRLVALVTQETHVFDGTVRDNLTLAAPEADESVLWSALERTGGAGWVRALPDGLETVVGSGGLALSASRTQSLALTRLVLRDPAVVVLDEATAEAGSAGARELERAAGAALEGRTALVVAHRLSQTVDADRIVVLADGRVVEEGTHADLVAAGGTFAGLWEAWTART